MIGPEGDPSPYDSAFFVIQLATLVAWLLAFATVPWQRRFPRANAVAIGFAALTAIVLPLVWNVGFPVHGLGKLRILLGAPLTAAQVIPSCLWAVRRAADAIRPRWPAARPFVVLPVVGVVLWVVLY